MADIIPKQISTTIQNSAAFSLLARSKKDKQNHEDLAIEARYINYLGKPATRGYSLVKLVAANAKSIFDGIINKLNILS